MSARLAPPVERIREPITPEGLAHVDDVLARLREDAAHATAKAAAPLPDVSLRGEALVEARRLACVVGP